MVNGNVTKHALLECLVDIGGALGALKGAKMVKNEAEGGEKHKIDNNDGTSYSDMLKCHQYCTFMNP